jgi:catechol 2,3-dioxygenase-like lactoylglutathione lyase family enzyme
MWMKDQNRWKSEFDGNSSLPLEESRMMLPIPGILETCLYVDDLAVAEDFYRRVLGLECISFQADRHLFFRCGRGMLLLFRADASRRGSADIPPHGAEGPGHLAFSMPEDQLSVWHRHLEAEGVAIEQEVHWPRGGLSIYFRDPAGNSLELATPGIWGIE